ncbi:MAG: ABC transporter ATP-binding protein [Candidatus Hydrogenedentes bacterium]|nr:ABC transporter ATP-binding protein [Candidatus Hydrogenedentota bacterium]
MNKVIECRNVQKRYDDGTRVLEILKGVDLEVYSGEILAISGPSGVGKSTLLHLMGTLDTPSNGEILFRDKALTKLGRAQINHIRNREIGFVFQFYHLLPEFTAVENVMMPALCKGMGRKAAQARAEQLLEKVGLTERMTHKPGQLSGGEQQRVAIARALYNEPSVVLTDEPTGNLDEKTGSGITDLLFDLNERDQMTLVIVTHDEGLAAQAHRWVHLHEGKAQARK